MSRLSRETKREAQQTDRSAQPVEVRVTGGAATVDGVPLFPAPGEEPQQAVLNHLQRLAHTTGRPVLATVHDSRIGYVVRLQVNLDGSSSFTGDPVRMAVPGTPNAPVPPEQAQQPRRDRPTPLLHAVDEPPAAEQPAAEPSVAEPSVAEPSVAEPSVAEPSVAEPPVVDGAVAEAAGVRGAESAVTTAAATETAPAHPLRAVPAPPVAAPLVTAPPVPGTVQAPTGVFGPPPVMDGTPAPAAVTPPAPAVVPARAVIGPQWAPRTDSRVEPLVEPLIGPLVEPEAARVFDPDPRHTPARGFDAVAEEVLGDEPVTVTAEGAALLAEPVSRINEAVRAGRIEAAAELAERTVAEASATFGDGHTEVLHLRELTAYIAYLAGDPLRAFHLSLDLARQHRQARDGEGAYGNVRSAATAWRAVRDPEHGLRLGRDLIDLWVQLTTEDGPAADDPEELDSARARMARLTERARRAAENA
ncbi:tetratricopeptide repeat protein [Streptomyces sp. NPDC007157]|uniref:tetratricopeptide repeat protein n=1 Tax=Streptomyces sp. NPDC007157 TaxID=3154681 RepID=UPI0033D67D5A